MLLRLPTIALACLALAGGGALAGCGGDDGGAKPGAGTTTPTGAGGSVAVSIKNVKFLPHDVTAKVGQTITWTNDDGSIAHNVTATDGADFASDTLNGGDTFSYTPRKAGTIAYVCTIHNGQDGTITVTK